MLLHPTPPRSTLDPSLANVPVELYREIVSQLNPRADKTALRSLCLVSQSLRGEAERWMYGTCKVSKAREVALLCDVIAREPRIAALVGELIICTPNVPRVELDEVGVRAVISGPFDPIPDTCTDEDFLTPAGALVYWRTLARALRSLPNLQNLTIAGDRALSLAWILAGTTFKLRKFCGYMAFDAFLASFLYEQSNSLTDLELLTDGSWTGETILGLHRVSTMRVCLLDLDMAAHLVKGRPVTHLQVTTASLHDAEVAEIAREWRGSTGPVRAFTVDFGDDDVSPNTLRLIGEAFPQLRLLGNVPIDLEYLDEFCEALKQVPNLRTLLINNREPHPLIKPEYMFAIAERIRSSHPTLRTIGFVYWRKIAADAVVKFAFASDDAPPDTVPEAVCYRFAPYTATAGRWEYHGAVDPDELWVAAGNGLDD